MISFFRSTRIVRWLLINPLNEATINETRAVRINGILSSSSKRAQDVGPGLAHMLRSARTALRLARLCAHLSKEISSGALDDASKYKSSKITLDFPGDSQLQVLPSTLMT